MAGYSLMTLLLVGVRYISCDPTPLDELTINLNLREKTEDKEMAIYETFDEEQEMKDGQTTLIIPVVIGGYNDNGNLVRQDEFFGRNGKWLVMAYPLQSRRSGMGVAGRINMYIAGGQDRFKAHQSDVYQRTFPEGWKKSKDLQIARTFLTLSIVNIVSQGKPQRTLLVTGGIGAGNNVLKSTELLSPETKTWGYSTPMTKSRVGHAAVVLNNIPIILGGYTKSNKSTDPTETTETTECFRTDQKWYECPSMKEKRAFHSATVLGDDIYVCGGQKHFRGVKIYLSSCEVDKNHTGFVPAPAMLTTRAKFGMVTMDGEVWAIGGENSAGKVLNTVEKFNPQTQQWTEHDETLLHPRKLFGATTVLVTLPG